MALCARRLTPGTLIAITMFGAKVGPFFSQRLSRLGHAPCVDHACFVTALVEPAERGEVGWIVQNAGRCIGQDAVGSVLAKFLPPGRKSRPLKVQFGSSALSQCSDQHIDIEVTAKRGRGATYIVSSDRDCSRSEACFDHRRVW
jgi:hypothetical protein